MYDEEDSSDEELTRDKNFSDSPDFSQKANAMKYQQEPAQFGMVSVSRLASPPHFGQVVFTNSGITERGDSPVQGGDSGRQRVRAGVPPDGRGVVKAW